MFSPEFLEQLRLLVADYGLTKWELFGLIAFLVLAYRLPKMLEHRREMTVIKADFGHKSSKLQAKIADQLAKRSAKAAKIMKGKK